MMKISVYFRKLRDQMVNDPLPTERVAAGWALGMFVGCFVPFGLQLLVSVPLAFVFRVSKIGATVGTLITNPVTIFIIYPVQTWVGVRLLGDPRSWKTIVEACETLRRISLLSKEGWALLSEVGEMILAGFFTGGLLLALVCTPPTYFIVRSVVRKYRAAQA